MTESATRFIIEPTATAQWLELLKQAEQATGCELDETIEIVDVIDSVADSVKYLRTHGTPELIFMDIQLSDGISFEIFDQVEIFTPVIFTTAFDEYMLRAFKVNSIDYLLKPIKPEEVSNLR